MINAAQTGTEKRTVVSAGVTDTPFTPSPDMTELPGEIKRIEAVSGAAIAPDQISLAILDTGTDTYNVTGIGLYLDEGTLLAVFSQDNPFMVKTEFSFAHFQYDVLIKDASIKPEDIQFGSLEFLVPPATETMEGVARIATKAEYDARESKTTIITPQLLGLFETQINTVINAFKSALAPAGIMQLMPFRASELPTGWHHANGDLYAVDSVIGKALLALPDGYKEDWKIVESGGIINMPNMYHTDGRAYFPRAGTLPGVIEEDTIRNITGSMAQLPDRTTTVTGAFQSEGYANNGGLTGGSQGKLISFDASRVVPTSEENRPLNISFVPAVYLGV